MVNQRTLWKWIEGGSRRHLLVTQLYKPLTTGQLCVLCQQHNPKIRIQDVHALLLDLIEKGLVRAVNRRRRVGRVYYLTRHGCNLLSREAGLDRPPLDRTVDWQVYGNVLAGRLKRLLLKELDQPTLDWWLDCTPSGLKRRLHRKHPTGLSTIAKSLRKMEGEGVVETRGRKKATNQRLYGLTDSGRRVLKWMVR